MVDTRDLKSLGHRGCAGSSPASSTRLISCKSMIYERFFFLYKHLLLILENIVFCGFYMVLLRLCKPICKPENTMKATVNVLCYKSKTLSNGEHPLMICLCKDNKRKYICIGASVNPRFWDFDKNKPKRNCPNKEQLSKHFGCPLIILTLCISECSISNQ